MAEEPQWVEVQKKTFTKWMNNHLVKKGYGPIVSAQDDFETGIKLMELINALYDVPIPKHNKIHRHRPDLLDFDPLDKNNAAHNLELAFSVAEKELGIPRLLDVEDLLNVARPDERSIMTYVSEYFHCFAGQDLKEVAARRIQKFVQFNQSMEKQEAEYEDTARELLQWISDTTNRFASRDFGDSKSEANQFFEAHKKYLHTEKPPRAAQKLDLEASFADIQTKLKVYGRTPYAAPSELTPEAIDEAWDRLEQAEKAYGKACRDNMFRFISKTESTISPEQLEEFEASFRHFDKDRSGALDKIEFKAALSALSVPFKDDNAFNQLFKRVSQGNEKISKEQFMNFLIELNEDKDTPEQIKQSFAVLSDQANTITVPQLQVQPLGKNEIGYLSEKMPSGDGSHYNYIDYTDSCFSA